MLSRYIAHIINPEATQLISNPRILQGLLIYIFQCGAACQSICCGTSKLFFIVCDHGCRGLREAQVLEAISFSKSFNKRYSSLQTVPWTLLLDCQAPKYLWVVSPPFCPHLPGVGGNSMNIQAVASVPQIL